MEMWGRNCEAIKNVIEGTLLLALLPPSLNAFFFLLVRETSTATSFAPDANYQTHFSIIKYRSAHALPAERRKRFFWSKINILRLILKTAIFMRHELRAFLFISCVKMRGGMALKNARRQVEDSRTPSEIVRRNCATTHARTLRVHELHRDSSTKAHPYTDSSQVGAIRKIQKSIFKSKVRWVFEKMRNYWRIREGEKLKQTSFFTIVPCCVRSEINYGIG